VKICCILKKGKLMTERDFIVMKQLMTERDFIVMKQLMTERDFIVMKQLQNTKREMHA
jgi:hypothetical protein